MLQLPKIDSEMKSKQEQEVDHDVGIIKEKHIYNKSESNRESKSTKCCG